MLDQSNLKIDKKKILLVGDIFLDKRDISIAQDILVPLCKSYNVIANFEMCPLQNDMPKKNLPLHASEEVKKFLSTVDSLYFSILNNHLCDYEADFDLISKNLNHLNVINNLNDLTSPIYIGNQAFLFFGDKFEDVNLNTNFLEFNSKTLNKVKVKDMICIIHGGLEYKKYPSVRQRFLAKTLIDKGAKSVIFHHSHVEGVCEIYNEKLIHYGLGNFIFSKINNLHGISSLNIPAVMLDLNSNLVPGRINYGKFQNYENIGELVPSSNYKSFYKKKYILNESFRPRQLYKSDFLNNLIFFSWISIARPLVKFGVSKNIKKILKNILNK